MADRWGCCPRRSGGPGKTVWAQCAAPGLISPPRSCRSSPRPPRPDSLAGTVHAHQAHGEIQLHLVGLPADENPLDLAAPTVLAVGPLLRELIIAYTRSPDDSGPERDRLRAVLLDRLRASPQEPLHLPAPADPLLRTLCDILRADPADGRTLAELGRAVGASGRTLSRLFRNDLGMTFPQWRTQLRLHHALVLLAGNTPVTTVAHRCGWSSASTFIDVFRRTFGHTPGTRPRS
ncbi:helix-turn-helix domain-containing protein [Streptomyces sp. NPDC005774]|uniref:helix-turn-helix transcriptional regulator n=1 Tax=Streptomyces sp. NPDC005774 TaxID=3364728 RepID=UPI0036A8A04A